MSDIVTLRMPRHPQYYSVARLVVGGLAAGLSLSYDALDDLQLAIGSLLDSEDLPIEGDLILELDVNDSQLKARIGRFEGTALASALEGSAEGEDERLDLRRLLDTIVDSVEIEASDDGQWITLTKRVTTAV